MRALVFEGPAPDAGSTRVREMPEPRPGAAQVSIAVTHAGVNFKDVMARRGDAGYVSSWPFVPGLEVAGTVLDVGEHVAGLSSGDRVVAFTGAGGLAEIAVAEASLTVPVPEALELGTAAAAPGALVTAELLLTDFGRLGPGQTVLVHSAAGAVGGAVAQLARAIGAGLLVGTVGSTSRIGAARDLGYDVVLTREDDPATVLATTAEVRDGFDLILDPQGTTQLDVDLRVLAPAGRIVLFGNAPGEPLAPLPPLAQLMGANATITGFSLAALAGRAPERLREALRRTLGHVAAGTLRVDVNLALGLEAAADAQQALAEGRGRGKHVVQIHA